MGIPVFMSKQVGEILGVSYTLVSIYRKNNEKLFEEGKTHFRLSNWEMECFKVENSKKIKNPNAYNQRPYLYTKAGLDCFRKIIQKKRGETKNMEPSKVIKPSELKIKEHKGQRVVTFKDIDEVHGRVEGTASRNFKSNRKHFVEGTHYYLLTRDDFRPEFEFGKNAPSGTLITERGYLLLVKSFTDDLSWEIQDKLVESYFRVKETTIQKVPSYMIDDPIKRAELWIQEQKEKLEIEKTNQILMHVNKTYTATEIAKEIGFKSAIALNKDLQSRKVQFQQNGTWVFYSKYADKGYVEIKQEVLDNGRVIYHRRFTQLGREFLLKLYDVKEA